VVSDHRGQTTTVCGTKEGGDVFVHNNEIHAPKTPGSEAKKGGGEWDESRRKQEAAQIFEWQ
jgi:hypothetical protein